MAILAFAITSVPTDFAFDSSVWFGALFRQDVASEPSSKIYTSVRQIGGGGDDDDRVRLNFYRLVDASGECE